MVPMGLCSLGFVFSGQVVLGVGSWLSNRATEGSNPRGTRLYFIFLRVMINCCITTEPYPLFNVCRQPYVYVSSCTNAYVKCTCVIVYIDGGDHTASYFVRMCNSHSGMHQYSSETLHRMCKIGVNWSTGQYLQNVLSERLYFLREFGVDVANILFMLQQFVVI